MILMGRDSDEFENERGLFPSAARNVKLEDGEDSNQYSNRTAKEVVARALRVARGR